MYPSVSVIICTSPGREDNLHYCLAMLSQQTSPPDEVIVVSDGATRSEFVCLPFMQTLNLCHDWRPNDMCVSRSRNRGAQLAQGEILVFLDTDIMLNPQAIAAYRQHLSENPDTCVYGYFGYAGAFVAPSQWHPERRVNFLDIRFCGYTPTAIFPSPYLQYFPHWYALGANFALTRTLFMNTKGFNEKLVGWGLEDLEFAEQLNRKHIAIAFSLDAWAEHQVHPKTGMFYQMHAISGEFIFSEHPLQYSSIYAEQTSITNLCRSVFEYYHPNLDHDLLTKFGYTDNSEHIIIEAELFPKSIRHHLPEGIIPQLPAQAQLQKAA